MGVEQEKNSQARGAVFNIQRYSIHDGPGIRTTVFFKGCPLSCFWCQNPESQKRNPEIFLFRDMCTHCAGCVSECPTGASSFFDDVSRIDRDRCNGCGKCVEFCPNEARRLVGRDMTVEEVIGEVEKDVKFYENSGGGVTLSGGEPTAQSGFALEILRNCKALGIHTVLDTCGYAPWSIFEELMPYVDLFLYDIKCINSKKHHEATGKSNDLILGNVKKLCKDKNMKVRVPMIPGFNDTRAEVKEIARFLKEELGPVEVELLEYNKWGENKYERLEREGVALEKQEEEYVEDLKAVFRFEFGMAKGPIVDKDGEGEMTIAS